MALEIELRTRQTVEYLVRELPRLDQDKAIKKGFQEAAQVYRREAKQNMLSLGRNTGNLWGSLTTQMRSMRSGVPAVVGFKRDAGNHAHLLDLGTDERWTEERLWKGTRYRGRGPATLFFTRAREEGEPEAKEALIRGVQRAVERINSRM